MYFRTWITELQTKNFGKYLPAIICYCLSVGIVIGSLKLMLHLDVGIQTGSKDPRKHLRWKALQQQFTAFSCSLALRSSQSQMFGGFLATSLGVYIFNHKLDVCLRDAEAIIRRYFAKELFLKISQNSLNTCVRFSFLTLFKKKLKRRCFPVNFAIFKPS